MSLSKFRTGSRREPVRSSLFILVTVAGLLALETSLACAETPSPDEDPGLAVEQKGKGQPVHREAINMQGDIVAVDLSLVGENLLEAKVTGFMKQTRPRLENVILMGPVVGRLAPTTREVLRAGLEEDPPYPTKRSGLLVMNQGSKQLAEGTLIRERFQYELPVEKMRQAIRKKGGKARYEFVVTMSSANRGGDFKRYTFDLEALPQLLLADSGQGS